MNFIVVVGESFVVKDKRAVLNLLLLFHPTQRERVFYFGFFRKQGFDELKDFVAAGSCFCGAFERLGDLNVPFIQSIHVDIPIRGLESWR